MERKLTIIQIASLVAMIAINVITHTVGSIKEEINE